MKNKLNRHYYYYSIFVVPFSPSQMNIALRRYIHLDSRFYIGEFMAMQIVCIVNVYACENHKIRCLLCLRVYTQGTSISAL